MELRLQLLTPEQWTAERKRLIGFAIRFGDKRLTATSMHAFRTLEPEQLSLPSGEKGAAAVVVASLDGRIAGIGYAGDAGENGCFVVVHSDMRARGIGSKIVKGLMSRFERLACSVACDNAPSMALCFKLGMIAVAMNTGPTGKPTLRFERRISHDTAGTRNSNFVSQ
ncbi:GNAT family N-acetyltransferase [Paenibacillus protaetiae]|uniref:GNAT family N-acetyltransferase n=1 Tax=Paenibacillus protaetiae TaxID=2509456 RepID=A0A4P6EQJ3_9BACL|nr:GNAT family N-acetyltransferase [Paenibacillus protaetiae]QAY65102.1 GNAT family N-acetyltransferase [Paenibacillus protaetiae]